METLSIHLVRHGYNKMEYSIQQNMNPGCELSALMMVNSRTEKKAMLQASINSVVTKSMSLFFPNRSKVLPKISPKRDLQPGNRCQQQRHIFPGLAYHQQ